MGVKPETPGFNKASQALEAAHIRLFGLQLGTYYLGIYQLDPIARVVDGFRFPGASISPNLETMFDLADRSGGFFIEEDTENPIRTYKLTPDDLKRLDELVGQIYKSIVEYYDLRLRVPPEGFTIELSDPVRQKLAESHIDAYLAYPHNERPCLPEATSN